MVLVSFRVRFTIVALELLVIVPIEEVPSKVRLLIVARGPLPLLFPNTIALIPELPFNVIVLSVGVWELSPSFPTLTLPVIVPFSDIVRLSITTLL